MASQETPMTDKTEQVESAEDELATSYINELTVSSMKARKFTKVQQEATRVNHVWTEDDMKKIVIMRYGSLDTNSEPKYTFRELAEVTKKSVTWCQTIVTKYIARSLLKDGSFETNCKANAYIQWVLDKKEQAENKSSKHEITSLRPHRLSGKWPGSTIAPQDPCAPYEKAQQATEEFLQQIIDRLQDPSLKIAQKEALIKQQIEAAAAKTPKNFLCPLTNNLMKDPVFITSGFTFDREPLLKHFETKGYFDPLSNQEVDPKFMVPNTQLGEQIKQFMVDNPTVEELLRQDNLKEMRKKCEGMYKKPKLSELWMKHPGAQMMRARKRFKMREGELGIVLDDKILKRLKHKEIEILLKAPNDVLSAAIATLNGVT